MAQIATPATGLQSVQDLYDLINGKTTTTSGGDTTTSGANSVVKTDQGISQESMNAMLQNILSGTQGLASVAQGQRTAGGYNSATNRMLINDLMTRSASQVAQQNQSKTVTTVSAPQTTTTAPKVVQSGGATIEGVAKTAGTLGGLQLLASTLKDTDTIGKSGLFKKLTGVLSEVLGTTDSPTTTADVNPGQQYNSLPSSVADYNAEAASPSVNAAAQVSPINSMEDQASDTPTYVSNDVFSTSGSGSNGESSGGGGEYVAPVDTSYTQPDFEDINFDGGFADGGLVSAKRMARMADGGQVGNAPKKPSNLSTNQFAKVIDPRTGLIGTGTGINEEGVAQASATQTTQTPNKTTNNPVLAQIPDAVFTNPGSDGRTGSDTNNGDSSVGGVTGGVTSSDVADAGRLAGALGSLGKSRDLSNAGTALGLASAQSPAQFGLGVANVATKGMVGQAANAYGVATNPSISNITDLAMALANPTAAAVNAISSTLGIATIGEVVSNIANMVSPNQAMSVEQQAAAQSAKDNPNSTQAAAEANQVAAQNNVDPLDALMDVTNAFGTGTDAVGGSVGTTTGADIGGTSNTGSSTTDSTSGDSNSGGTDSSGHDSSDGSSGGQGFSNGGEVSGAGGPIDDKIHTMLSDGEYVLSADTVKAIGVDKLDALQAKYHVPAAVQRLKGYARG